MYRIGVLAIVGAIVAAPLASAREWTDKSGHYTISADIVASSDTVVVLRKPNSDLVSVPIDDLYCAPFFLFTDEVVGMLKPGW